MCCPKSSDDDRIFEYLDFLQYPEIFGVKHYLLIYDEPMPKMVYTDSGLCKILLKPNHPVKWEAVVLASGKVLCGEKVRVSSVGTENFLMEVESCKPIACYGIGDHTYEYRGPVLKKW